MTEREVIVVMFVVNLILTAALVGFINLGFMWSDRFDHSEWRGAGVDPALAIYGFKGSFEE